MESEKRIAAAKDVVRHLQTRYSKPHHRIHGDAAQDNANRLRALEGLCGKCPNLELRFGRKDGKEIVALGCSKVYTPISLYENTPLGTTASCPGYSKRKI